MVIEWWYHGFFSWWYHGYNVLAVFMELSRINVVNPMSWIIPNIIRGGNYHSCGKIFRIISVTIIQWSKISGDFLTTEIGDSLSLGSLMWISYFFRWHSSDSPKNWCRTAAKKKTAMMTNNNQQIRFQDVYNWRFPKIGDTPSYHPF